MINPILSKAKEFYNSSDYRTCLEAVSNIKSSRVKLTDKMYKLSSYSDIESPDSWIALENDKQTKESNLAYAKRSLDSIDLVVKENRQNLDDTNIRLEFYSSVLDSLTEQYIQSLSQLLTSVYQSVYDDDSKSVQLAMEDYRGKKVVRLNIINRIVATDYKEELAEDGGSVSIILGIVISMYFLLITGGARIIMLDESFSALHYKTISRFLPFLKLFRDEYGFAYLVIAHDVTRYREYVDHAYEVDNGMYTEVQDLDSYFEKYQSMEAENG